MDEQNDTPKPAAPPPPILNPVPRPQAPVPPPRKKSKLWIWLLGIGIVGTFVSVFVLLKAMISMGSGSGPSFGPKIALIYVEGPITSSSSLGLFGDQSASAETVIKDLREAEDSGVKAIVLRINSPGGSAAASQEIYSEVMRIRQSKIPVIVSLGDVAASGGYYIASSGNKIFATPGTLTGSIGVIIQSLEMSELFNKIGVKPITVKSGKYKDIFSSNRPVTEEEMKLVKAMIMDIYYQFVDDVVAGRKGSGLTREKLLPIADGRIMTGRQALNAKLVDKIGGLQDAIDEAARMSGIKGKPIIWRVKRSLWDALAESKIEIKPKVTIDLYGAANGGSLKSLQVP